MNKRFFIIMGRSGSGKGTQAALLKTKLEAALYGDVKHVMTGVGFRKLVSGESYSSKTCREITNKGGLNPEFLAIWNWTSTFIEELKEDTSVILDGAPRRLVEVDALHGAISFYGYERPTVIYLDVSESFAVERLTSRGREDDKDKEERERKMKWFLEDMLPCIARYKSEELYDFIHVNGEGTIEAVHDDLWSRVSALL